MSPLERTSRPYRLALPILALLLAGCVGTRQRGPAPAASPTGHSSGAEAQAPVRAPAVYANPSAGPAAERTRTGRYSYVANGATAAQIDPLLAIIEVRLPRNLATIEDAADYLLKRSGYCLMEPSVTEVRHLLRLPIPDVHRHLGPMTLREALLALGGQAYALVVDEVYREVGFKVVPAGGGT